MSYIDDELAILPRWEARIPYLYRDSKGNATTAIGLMLPNLGASLALPWKNADWTNADEAQVAGDWGRVMALPADRVAGFYHSAVGLQLQQSDIDSLTKAKLMEFDADLRKDFPGYDAFPESVKTRLLDMEWNLGDAKLRGGYPHFDAAVDARNWSAAALECGRDSSDPAFAARNAWTAAGFEQAAKLV